MQVLGPSSHLLSLWVFAVHEFLSSFANGVFVSFVNGNLGTQGLLNKIKPWSVPLERRCPLCHEGRKKKLSEASAGNRKTRLRTTRPDALHKAQNSMTSLASQFKLQMLEKQPISLCEPDQKNTWLTKKIFQMTPQVVEKSVNFFSYFQKQIYPDDPITQLTDGNRQKWSRGNLCR